MKIENRENVKGTIKTIVEFENKKYIRLQKSKYTGLDMQPVVEWKNKKTNHLVNSVKHKLLEEKFKQVDTTTKPVKLYNESTKGSAQFPSSASTILYDFKHSFDEYKTNEQIEIDKRILEHLKFGNLLSAVKYYKGVSGLGLKEAKDYVDAIIDKEKSIKTIENSFKHKSSEDLEVDKRILEIISTGKMLDAVRLYKDISGLGLKESKDYVEAIRDRAKAFGIVKALGLVSEIEKTRLKK